jgi:DNA-binding CsgD family transcriptional regulator
MPLTEAFYEAAILPELWERALNMAQDRWGADGVSIVSLPDCLSGSLVSRGIAELSARYIGEGWYKQDVRVARALPEVRHNKDLVTDLDLFSAEELERLPYYADFLGKSGFRWFAGTILSPTNDSMIGLSIDRLGKKDPFSADELTRIRQDLPHLRRAARLAAKGRFAYAEGLINGFERFKLGAVLVDQLGRVVGMNKKAEAYLEKDLQIVSSRLRSTHRESNKALQDLIGAITRPIVVGADPGLTSALLHRPGGLPLIVHSYPVVRQATDVFQGARGLLLISDPGAPQVPAQHILQEVFHLTPSELRVAVSLLKGLDTQEIATEHKVGVQTVRYHLKSIFSKTGTSHQAQLVSLLARFTMQH